MFVSNDSALRRNLSSLSVNDEDEILSEGSGKVVIKVSSQLNNYAASPSKEGLLINKSNFNSLDNAAFKEAVKGDEIKPSDRVYFEWSGVNYYVPAKKSKDAALDQKLAAEDADKGLPVPTIRQFNGKSKKYK